MSRTPKLLLRFRSTHRLHVDHSRIGVSDDAQVHRATLPRQRPTLTGQRTIRAGQSFGLRSKNFQSVITKTQLNTIRLRQPVTLRHILQFVYFNGQFGVLAHHVRHGAPYTCRAGPRTTISRVVAMAESIAHTLAGHVVMMWVAISKIVPAQECPMAVINRIIGPAVPKIKPWQLWSPADVVI